jgi:hypothetical protein
MGYSRQQDGFDDCSHTTVRLIDQLDLVSYYEESTENGNLGIRKAFTQLLAASRLDVLLFYWYHSDNNGEA